MDLGCGTGLMGPLLRSHVKQLEGVDLSAGMVQKAKERGCYDKLDVDELVACLNGRSRGGLGNRAGKEQSRSKCKCDGR